MKYVLMIIVDYYSFRLMKLYLFRQLFSIVCMITSLSVKNNKQVLQCVLLLLLSLHYISFKLLAIVNYHFLLLDEYPKIFSFNIIILVKNFLLCTNDNELFLMCNLIVIFLSILFIS